MLTVLIVDQTRYPSRGGGTAMTILTIRSRFLAVAMAGAATVGLSGIPATAAADEARPAAVRSGEDGDAKAKKKAKTKKKVASGVAKITLDGKAYAAVPADQCFAGGLGGPDERNFRGVVDGLQVWIAVGGRGEGMITAKSADESYAVWYEASSSYASEGASVGDPKVTKDGASGGATLANVNDGGTVAMSYEFRC